MIDRVHKLDAQSQPARLDIIGLLSRILDWVVLSVLSRADGINTKYEVHEKSPAHILQSNHNHAWKPCLTTRLGRAPSHFKNIH